VGGSVRAIYITNSGVSNQGGISISGEGRITSGRGSLREMEKFKDLFLYRIKSLNSGRRIVGGKRRIEGLDFQQLGSEVKGAG